MYRTLLVVALSLLVPSLSLAQHFPSNEALTARARAMADARGGGVVIGVLEADGSTRVVAAGSGGPNARPLGARSVFEIGSITKTLTATLLADMVAKGEVSLSAPIGTYLPPQVRVPSRAGREITLLDLVTHHSGLPRLPDGFAPADKTNPYADFTIEKLYAFLNGHTLRRDIGAEFEYSNVGMGLVGHALERAGRKSYEALVTERILKPLGMSMTAITVTKEMADWMTSGHGAGGVVVPHWTVTGGMAGAGGFLSTAEDLLKYVAANTGPPDSALERAMREAHKPQRQINERQTFGLAWYRQNVRDQAIIIGHTGGTAGYRTFIGFDPQKRVGLVVLTNSGVELPAGPLFNLLVPPPPTAPAATAAQHFPSNEDLKTMLRYLVEDGETPGIVLGVLEADGSRRIVFHGTAGTDARPLGPKSIFEIGSITKVFTGTLLADMVERGEVSLSDPVSKYLPTGVKVPSRNGREITLLDLATHRSALPRMPENLTSSPANPYPPYSIDDMYAFLAQHELRRDIGSEYEYSNIGVALLGHALSRAAGASYEELLRKRVLDPLGMRMTSTVVAGELSDWNTKGHNARGVTPYRGWAELPGMGALRSNAEDMLTFLAANMAAPDSRLARIMRSTHDVRAAVSEGVGIGLNWQVRTIGDRRLITHGGATAGYETLIGFDPDKRVGFVMLTNTAEFDDDVGLDFLRRGPPLAIPEIPLARDVLARYVGAYQMAPNRSMVVRLEPEGYLTLQAPGNVRFRLHAESDTKFFVKRAPWRITFTKNEAGETAGLVADLEGQVRTLPKVSDTGPPPAVVAGNAALDLPLAPEQMTKYAGTYTLDVNGKTRELRVFVENGQLMAQPAGQPASELLFQGGQEFRVAVNIDYRIVFIVDGDRVDRLTLHQGANAFQGTRKP